MAKIKKEVIEAEEVKEVEVVVDEKEARRQFLLKLQEDMAKERITSLSDVENRLRDLDIN